MTVHGPDCSFYQDDNETPQQINFQKLGGISDFVIIRAGQNNWVDPDFKVNWELAKIAKVPRGSYWFYDSRVSPVSQAQLWAKTLGSDLGELPMFADYEENYGGPYGGWVHFKAFIEELKKQCVNKEIGIYTAYYYWKDHMPAPGPDLEYFHQYTLWIANYGVSKPAVPVPWSADEWKFWQYTSSGNGALYGVESSNIDLNYYNGTRGEFDTEFVIESGEPEGDIVESWFDGTAQYTSGFRETPRPFYFHLTKFRRDAVARVHVNGKGFLGTALYFWNSRIDPVLGHPDIVINGDEGTGLANPPKAIGLSDGVLYKPETSETSIQWNNRHEILGIGWEALPGAYNACGGSNKLIENGAIQTLDDVYVDPRNSVFADDTHYYLITIDGRNNGTMGLTRKELAEFAFSLGATWGHNLDGGDSNSLVFNNNGVPVIKNNPPEGYLNRVINHVGFWLKRDVIPPTGDSMKYTCKVLLDTDERKTPSIYGIKTGKTFSKPTTWETDYYGVVSEKEAWVGTPDGFYTAQRYPRNLWPEPKIYVDVTENVVPPTVPPATDDYFIRYNSADEPQGRYEKTA